MMKPYKRSKYFNGHSLSVCKDPRDISSSLAGHTLTSSEDSYLKNSYPSVLKTAPR